MKKYSESPITQWIARLLFGVLALIAVYMGMAMTYRVMGNVLPSNPTMQLLALAFFDGGALAWGAAYVYIAKGANQRGVAFWLMVLDLLGVGAMVIGDILTGGQQLVNPPAWLGRFIIDSVIIVMLANLYGVYYYHINKPELQESIEAQNLEDMLSAEAMEQARLNVEREARALGAILARRATAKMKYRLALPMSEQELAEWNNETVEATAEDVPALPYPQRLTFWDMLKSFFGRGQSMPSHDTPQSVNSTANPINSPSQQDETPKEQ